MERRKLLEQIISNSPNKSNKYSEIDNVNAKILIPSSLKKYEGVWNNKTAGHLLRRTTMGFTYNMLDEAKNIGMKETIKKLFEKKLPITLPINYNNPSDTAPLGTTWVNEKNRVTNEFYRFHSLSGWWFGEMLNSGTNINMKMSLFLLNNFVTEYSIVQDARLYYIYTRLLIDNSLGNFRDIIEKITIDPSMLFYLNGEKNTRIAPNENFARELFELFTIGKGPLINSGDYTYYTEDDIKEAAKVLTGWQIDRLNNKNIFRSNRHDKNDKKFSYIFNNKVIKNNDDKEYIDLIDMIFEHPQTAINYCKKLYRWFVNYEISTEVETNIIIPMANLLRENNYNIMPVLQVLLTSEHFYDYQTIGCQLKNPLEFIINVYNNTNQKQYMPDYIKQYALMYTWGVAIGASQEMTLGDPPSVAGWAAYYQTPNYYQIWVNSVTLSARNGITDIMLNGIGIKRNGVEIKIDPKIVIEQFKDASDPNILINELNDLFFAIELTSNQKAYLKLFLVSEGIPDYVWSSAWEQYLVEPNNKENTNIVDLKLRLLFATIFAMSEYQLN